VWVVIERRQVKREGIDVNDNCSRMSHYEEHLGRAIMDDLSPG